MSSMRQDGERVVSLHPIFTLKRVVSAQETGDLSALCHEIQSFAAQHGDQHLIARGEVSLMKHMKYGELILIYEGPEVARRLIGMCVCVLSDHDNPAFELAYTAIDTAFRGRELARLAASAALVVHLMYNDKIEGIVLSCRPSNTACQRAAEKLGVEFLPASELYPLIPRLKSTIDFHRHHHQVRNWREEPLLGLVQPQAVRDGAWHLLGASNPGGLAWRRSSRVFLDGEWYLTGHKRESSRQHLLEIAEGRRPRVRWWDDPPPCPRIGRCA